MPALRYTPGGGITQASGGGMFWLPAAISAIGGIGGALFGSRSNNRAARLQAQANERALQFERDRFNEEMQFARQQWEAQQAQEAPWRAYREAKMRGIARRRGINLPPTQAAPEARTMGQPLSIGGIAGTSQGQNMGINPAVARQEALDARRNSLRSIAGG